MSKKGNESSLHPDEFPEICRTCLSNCQVKNMTEQFYEDKNISQLLTLCVSVQEDEGNLPQNMCQKCVDELIRAYVFILKCRDNDDLLHLALRMHADDDPLEKEITPTSHFKPPENSFDPSVLDEFDLEAEFKDMFPDFAEEIALLEREKSEILLAKEQSLQEPQDDIASEAKDELSQFLSFYDKPEQSDGFSDFENIPDLNTNKEKRQRGPGKCEFCDLQFSTRRELALHKQASKHILGICEICGYLICGQRKLSQHMLTHWPEKPFECGDCHRTFTIKKNYKRHCLSHSDTWPFVCKICGRGFRTQKLLDDHNNIHTGERPYMCSTCGKTFTTQRTYYKHTVIHKPNQKLRIYVCFVCGRDFASKRSLEHHATIHAPHQRKLDVQCKECPQLFSNQSELKRHTPVHRNYTIDCKICGKLFYRNGHLVMHMRTHTGDTGYMCPGCHRRFFNVENMSKHQCTQLCEKGDNER